VPGLPRPSVGAGVIIEKGGRGVSIAVTPVVEVHFFSAPSTTERTNFFGFEIKLEMGRAPRARGSMAVLPFSPFPSKQERPPTERPHKVWSVHVPFPQRDQQILIPNCASPEATRWRSVELAEARDHLGRVPVP
jgi:hypothetical protein